jgi:phosphatidylglycerol:prolipoprotein diacylglycerol transferase
VSNHLIFPTIDPIIFTIPNVPFIDELSVRWYGMMYLVGFVTALLIANRQAAKPNSGWDKEQVSDLMFYGFLGVILGGRVGYVLFYQFERFLQEPLYLFQIHTGGMSFHGGLLGVILAIFWFARKTDKGFLSLGDFAAPLIPLGLGAGRIGNFINAELWGRTSDVPWAMVFPGAGPLPRHPSQLYEFFLEGIVLFIIIYWYGRKKRPVGSIGALFLLGYGCFRFFVEYFRERDTHLTEGIYNFISMGQLLSLPMVIIGASVIFYTYRKEHIAQKGAVKS